MKFNPNNFYHVFNRGNNKQKIFFQKRNYQFFEGEIKEYICPHCHVLSYCLMPNHFHLLIYLAEQIGVVPLGNMQILERKIGTLQSSYTRAINKQENKTGSLFQPKCKMVEISSERAFACFHYIHQNPLRAGLTQSLVGWDYSSFHEYINNSDKNICSKETAYQLLHIPKENAMFIEQSYKVSQIVV